MSQFLKVLFGLLLVFSIASCKKDASITDIPENDNESKASPDSLKYNPEWTYLSHGKANPDYSLVFPQSSVNRMEIVMTAARWASIRANIKSLFGSDFGVKPNNTGPNFPDAEPEYVDVQIRFNNKTWKNVGFRLKGNSSLSQAWGQGVYKLPFRLNFDKFEDTYPGIKNQHFYGFRELAFSSGFKDQSLIREKLAPDVFRLAGIPAAQTAFYTVYIDFGAGLKYCGVYTVVEIPEDHLIKIQFGEEKGNIYKPESRFQNFIQSEFDKKNNETEASFTDVQAFITALNSSLRTSNVVQWRSNLEAVFNVDHFIKYLAVNNTIVNWDSYGNIAHNFYLYNHSVNKLTWIPWDHNEAFSGTPGIIGTVITGSPPGGARSGISLSMNEVAANWPLIRYIADDEVYLEKYKTYLKQFKDNVFTETTMNALIDKYSALVTPYAIGANGEQTGYTYLTGSASFTNSFNVLKMHVVSRRELVTVYVP